jgi:fatty acyl-ACP thioesterase A
MLFSQSIPQNILESHQLQTITLDYRQECNYNDVVESFASLEREIGGGSDLVFLHIVKLAGSDVEINRARTVWREKAAKSQPLQNIASDQHQHQHHHHHLSS